jgi:small subunit ribosomal protein S17
MAKKNTEEIEETAVAEGAEAAEAGDASAEEVKTEAAAEETAAAEEPKAEAAPAEEKPKRAKKTAEPKAATPSGEGEEEERKSGKRAEKIGVVTSDKMTNTVVVRVDRLIKHPIYRKYVRKRKKFIAHDEKGAKIGDKVKIVETRPLSARKRWRVVEIIQKAEM